jgi:hypothetical protein
VGLVCDAYSDHEYDESNDSFQLQGMAAGGLLEVCVTAESFYRSRKGREDGILGATVGGVGAEVFSDGVCLD